MTEGRDGGMETWRGCDGEGGKERRGDDGRWIDVLDRLVPPWVNEWIDKGFIGLVDGWMNECMNDATQLPSVCLCVCPRGGGGRWGRMDIRTSRWVLARVDFCG